MTWNKSILRLAVEGGGHRDKTVREVYLWPFADGVKSGMMAVMCAMNKANDTLSWENNKAAQRLSQVGPGLPWHRVPRSTSFGSANAGLDYGSSSLGPREPAPSTTATVRADHASLIRQVGREATVLLKNDNQDGRGLPLNKPRGAMRDRPSPDPTAVGRQSLHWHFQRRRHGWSRWRHAWHERQWNWNGDEWNGNVTDMGSGSPPLSISSRIWQRRENQCDVGSGTASSPSIEGYTRSENSRASASSFWTGEGGGRSELSNDDQDTLVQIVAYSCNNTVFVMKVTGSGNAIADFLEGVANHNGKLSYTLAANDTDYPGQICSDIYRDYTEGVLVDYRHFDSKYISI
ncbi:glycoside hydrolase family 3 protein [Parathielavia appendiculata]|uniref:beta-glucosidase n=1 Tax=Parathielavia appendiculata TaxID=2587402 RepID=A0AAN6TQL3_9PEZI|nr:glycoside hydrolase family 3 protein [Parathielavia appendiculata]